MSVDISILDKVRLLAPDKQQEVVDFIEFEPQDQPAATQGKVERVVCRLGRAYHRG